MASGASISGIISGIIGELWWILVLHISVAGPQSWINCNCFNCDQRLGAGVFFNCRIYLVYCKLILGFVKSRYFPIFPNVIEEMLAGIEVPLMKQLPHAFGY
jgi:hypothetical protein